MTSVTWPLSGTDAPPFRRWRFAVTSAEELQVMGRKRTEGSFLCWPVPGSVENSQKVG